MALNYEKPSNVREARRALSRRRCGPRESQSLYLYRGDVQRALAQVREVLKLNPRSTSDRYNLAIQSVYAGDFEERSKRAPRDQESHVRAAVPAVALATLFLDDISEARATYQRAEQANPSKGGPLGRLGRADLCSIADSPGSLVAAAPEIENDEKEAGAECWLAVVALAETHPRSPEPEAVTAALKAAGKSEHESVWFPGRHGAGRGRARRPMPKIAVQMENTFQSHLMAYAQLVRAAIAARDGRYGQAVDLFRDSIKRRDTWLGRLMLGKLYVRQSATPSHRRTTPAGSGTERRGRVLLRLPNARYPPPLSTISPAPGKRWATDARSTSTSSSACAKRETRDPWSRTPESGWPSLAK